MSKAKVTIKDIAGRVGVSQSTVSRALAGHSAISEETRQRVVHAARQLEYPEKPVVSPRAPTRMIGVVVAALHNQFYVHLLDCLHNELRAFGYHMTLIIDSLSQTEDYSAFEPLMNQYLDGILFTTASVDSRLIETLKMTGLPVVLAVRAIDGMPFDTVEVDNRIAGREAVRHLWELGHRTIGFIMGPKDISTSRDRHRGAVEWLAQKGIDVPQNYTYWTAFTHESGYSSLLGLMNLAKPPTAVVCGNDTIAIGALEAAHRHHIDVPRKLSIIGFDDIAMAGWEMIQLTTIRQPIAEMAALAARRLIEQIRAGRPLPPRHDVLPVSLIRRGTTAPPHAPELG